MSTFRVVEMQYSRAQAAKETLEQMKIISGKGVALRESFQATVSHWGYQKSNELRISVGSKEILYARVSSSVYGYRIHTNVPHKLDKMTR